MSLNDSLFGEEKIRWQAYEKVLKKQSTKPVQQKLKADIIKPPIRQGETMACGEFAEPIYKLIEELGDTEAGRELVLDNLVKFLPGSTIESFVKSFRRDYDLIEDENENSESQTEVKSSTYFSSLVPEC